MRDNGLGDGDLTSYAVLADVDPTVADLMLDLLRQEGIAAYAGPSPTSRGGMGEVILAGAPIDRMWVHERDLEAARGVLNGYLADLRPPVAGAAPATTPAVGSVASTGAVGGGRSSADDDAAWQEIIAGFDATPTDVVPRWPANEDVEPVSEPASRRRRRSDREAGWPDEIEDEVGQEGDAGEDDEHFVPLPPPPVPPAQPATRWALLAIGGGIALLLLSAFSDLPDTSTLAFLGLVGIIAGFVTLVVRLHNGPPTDSGPDNGAVL